MPQKPLFALLLALTLLTAAGCGAQQPSRTPVPRATPAAATEAPAATEPISLPGGPEPEGAVHVRSVEELLDAIAPDTEIILEPGTYNLSEYVDELLRQTSYDRWSEQHPNIFLRDVYDGAEVVIQNADNLSISGATDDPADTELVLDARYGTVLCFENCADPVLRYLTLGHSDGGDCSGDVLSFCGCSGVRLNTLDLYGCGVYGLQASEGTSDIYVFNTTLRDCAFGPLDISACHGEITFQDCVLTGSGWGGYYWAEADTKLTFSGCTFGQQESNAWFFRDDADFVDCTWSEITEYPDYGDDDYEEWEGPFDPDALRHIPLDDETLSDSYWLGFLRIDPESGQQDYLDYLDFQLILDADHIGTLDWEGESMPLTWSLSSPYSAYLETPEGDFYLTLYVPDNDEELPAIWLQLSQDNIAYWFY